MRLIFVSHSFPPPHRFLSNVGGMQRVATELYEALQQREDVELRGIILRSTWSQTHIKTPFFLVKAWLELRKAITHEKVDAVLFSSMVTATLALPLRRLASDHNVKLAAIAHGRDVTLPVAPYQWLVPRVFASLDAVFPISTATERACRKRGARANSTEVIPNGIDPSRFDASVTERKKARQSLLSKRSTSSAPLADGDLILFSVGRHIKRKGFEWFVRNVMPLLPNDVHYWLAGDGPEVDAIQDAVQEANVEHRVRLLGRVSERELDALYHGTDLFIMPNILIDGDIEGFGIVMLEAGQCGLPTIASRIEGLTDVVEEGKNGYLVEHKNPDEFAAAIMHFREDREALAKASTGATEHVIETYSWENVASRYVRSLRNVISQS